MKQLKQLQAQLTSHGLLSDTYTLSGLIAFCSLSSLGGDLNHARQLFDCVTFSNRFIYNTLIRAYSNSNTRMESFVLLRRMMAQGFLPNNFTFPFVLKSVAEESAFEASSMLHSLIIKTGFASQVIVMNALLHVYVVCGYVCCARKVFDEIPKKSIVSWNSMIDGYSQMGGWRNALELFGDMRDLGLEPDEFTLTTLLSVCAQSGNLEVGRVFHHFIVTTNCVGDDLIVNNALVDMYGKCGEPASAQACFDRMPVRNVVSWTSLVRAYGNNGLLDLARFCFDQNPERSVVSWNAMIDCYICSHQFSEALVLYERMKISGIVPNEVTLINVLSACSQTGNFIVGKRTHEYIVQNIRNPSLTLQNSIIDMYAKCGHLDVAIGLFSMIELKNVVSWNVLIGALAAHGNALDAIELFKSMTCYGFFPDAITFVGVLSACSHGGLLELGQQYFRAMDVVYNVRHEIEHYACMVDLFGRRGCVGRAIELIRRMPMKPDAVIWGALLGACRIHGDLKTGLQALKQILELEAYSSGLFVLMSNLFCEMGRWEDVRKVRKLMNGGGVKKVEGRSLIEIGGKMHEFFVEDHRHESSSRIFILLDQLTDHLMYSASFCNSLETLLLIEE